MLWGRRQSNNSQAPPSDADQSVTREKLPAKLQEQVDRDDGYYDDLYSS